MHSFTRNISQTKTLTNLAPIYINEILIVRRVYERSAS